jgi:hypothetical protein
LPCFPAPVLLIHGCGAGITATKNPTNGKPYIYFNRFGAGGVAPASGSKAPQTAQKTAKMKATYFYKEYSGGELVPMSAPVEIVGSGRKTYQIKLTQFTRGYEPGAVIRVFKKNVRL